MSRLIDADKFIEDNGLGYFCDDCKQDIYKCQYHQDFTRMDICGFIDDAPTVDAVPVVHGKWLSPNERRPMYECDCCGWYVDIGGYKEFTYCPNCGAKMDGEVEEDER